MAINTRNKRASILGIGLAASIVYPNPSGTIDQAARQQTAYAYPGIDAGIAFTIPSGVLTTREVTIYTLETQ